MVCTQTSSCSHLNYLRLGCLSILITAFDIITGSRFLSNFGEKKQRNSKEECRI